MGIVAMCRCCKKHGRVQRKLSLLPKRAALRDDIGGITVETFFKNWEQELNAHEVVEAYKDRCFEVSKDMQNEEGCGLVGREQRSGYQGQFSFWE
jgi:hypothetical protein